MKTGIMAAVALAVVGAGCAKPPDSIGASYISDVPYRSYSCEQLGIEEIRLNQALATASKQQENARGADTVGVIFLGLPVSSLSGGNVAPEIARLKGEIEAVNRAGLVNGCNSGAAAPAA